jgi:hypothetical protein
MAIESLVGLGVFTLIMLGVSFYAAKHRTEDRKDRDRKDRDGKV